ncbi:DUF3575 domain-containing protein [Bacteroides fragilis]|uniref:DUF3575 domain-containing protein n=1 Tax=Bacteroides fragilis TaxID=817 RepID=UPI00189E8BBC|nr:DUF3575 domain-containing protein [Bacteroides fragilis]
MNNFFSCLIIAFILCTTLHAQYIPDESTSTVPDSSYVFHYPACIQMFKVDYKSNRQTLQQLKHSLQTFTRGRDTLYVNGYSGECDSSQRNRRTAYYRSNNLKGYLIHYYGLRERDFKTVNIPHNHPELGDIVIIGFSPNGSTAKAKEAIPEVVPEKEKTFPVETPVVEPKRQEQPPAGKETQKQPVTKQTETVVTQPEQPSTEPAGIVEPSGRYLAVKTNLAAWAGTIMNIAADVQVGKHVSVELPVLWCPWYVSDKHAVKTFTIQPEGRYWLSKPGEGHFFGIHAHIGWFSVKWDKDRYQDTERPLLGAGISYGYLLPFAEHWAGEFTLGAGYANMKYDTYYNIDNGARIDTRTKNYWGITRVGISVVYRFNLKK